ncbi:MAG: hypothetical protein ABI808_05180 [Pseudonocardiales bacterium]
MSDEHGAAIPPYEGRKSEASEEQDTYKDGARTAGATAPVTDPDMKGPEPDDTERGPTASPADEQPAGETPDGADSAASTGPSHTPGTGRAEDKPSD